MKKIYAFILVLFVCFESSAQINQYKNCSPKEISDFWEKTLSTNKKYKKFVKDDSQKIRALRSNFNENSQLAISKIEENNGFYEEDIFLNDYLTNLVQLLSGGINKKTKSLATANIMLDVNPNACAYPNGTLIFNTKLLAMMDCEEELLGVIAHEMAHFKLEHALSNFIMIEDKTKKSKKWANFASVVTTTLGTVADIAAGGDGTDGMIAGAITGMAVGEAIYKNLENMGYKFSQEQELEADKIAVALLEHIGISGSYYASALDKLRQEDYRFGREILKTKKKSTHPALDERISNVGNIAIVERDIEYSKKIAQILTVDAFIEKTIHKDYERTMAVFERISSATSLTLDDFLIMIPTMLDMSNTSENNNKVLSIVQTTINDFEHPDIQSLTKYEAMLYVRLKDKDQARNSLKNYIAYCDASISNSDKEERKMHLMKEKTWAENTLKRF